MYLTDNPDAAEAYAYAKGRRSEGGQNVMPLAIKLGNPYIADKELKTRMQHANREAADALTRRLQEMGHDGVILKLSDDAHEVVVFDPANVRSVHAQFAADKEGENGLLYSRSAGELQEKPGWLDRNELGEWEKGLALYHGIGRLAKPLLAKLKLANTAPQEFTEMMRDYRSQLNVAGMTASEMAKAGVQMTAEERALLSDILEKELPPGIEVSPEMQELAGTIRELLSRQGEQLADLGMLSRDSLERFKDTYLPRLYRQRTELFGGNDLAKMNREFNKAMRGSLGNALGGQHLKGRGIFKTVSRSEQADYEAKGYELRQDFGNQGKHAGKVLMWRDYTREERTQMGEERDAILRFTQGYVQTQADLAKGVLFQRIAQNEELASKTEVEGWKPVPNTTIAGTGGVHRYGALAGMYVHPDVFYHLEQQFAVQNAALKIWRASLGWWKMTKTVYNPVAHTNNVVSNFSLLFIAGGRVRDLQPAAASIRNKDALYREALELGLVGEAVDSAGIRELFTGLNNTDDDAVITERFFTRVIRRADELSRGVVGKAAHAIDAVTFGMAGKAAHAVGKAGSAGGKAVRKTSNVAQTFYRVEDEVFKMALYRMARSKGLSNTEARDYTLNFFFDYGEVPYGIKLLRDSSLLPFVSYTYKAIPAVLRGALTRPHRFLAVTGLMYALNAMSYAMLGDDADEEEERKYMPEYMKGMTSFGTPKLIRLPWNDSQGKPMFIDVYRWLPLGDFADVGNRTGGLPLPQFMNPNGPVVSTYNAMVNNTDTFTGGKLTQDYMTDGEKTVVRAKWIAGQILPASVGMPFSYHSNNVMDGLKNQMEGTKFAEVLEDLGWTGKTYRGEDKQLALQIKSLWQNLALSLPIKQHPKRAQQGNQQDFFTRQQTGYLKKQTNQQHTLKLQRAEQQHIIAAQITPVQPHQQHKHRLPGYPQQRFEQIQRHQASEQRHRHPLRILPAPQQEQKQKRNMLHRAGHGEIGQKHPAAVQPPAHLPRIVAPAVGKQKQAAQRKIAVHRIEVGHMGNPQYAGHNPRTEDAEAQPQHHAAPQPGKLLPLKRQGKKHGDIHR